MSRSTIVALVVVVVLLLGGGVVVLTVTGRAKARAALRAAFERHGLPPDWGEALGETESRLDPSPSPNMSAGDGARGGSFGVTQISERTARAWGYSGPMEALTDDVELAAELTALMVEAGFAERSLSGPFRVYRYGRPRSPEEMASVWNSGRAYGDPTTPASTAEEYIPRLLGHLEELASAEPWQDAGAGVA